MAETMQHLSVLFAHMVQFVVGPPHRVMGTAYLLLAVNSLMALGRRRQRDLPLRQIRRKKSPGFWQKAFVYTVFIAMGHTLDVLMMNEMMNELVGWEGSSQFLVCLDILRREAKFLLYTIEERYGMRMPLLNTRLDMLSEEDEKESESDEAVDRQIRELQEEIAALKERDKSNQEHQEKGSTP